MPLRLDKADSQTITAFRSLMQLYLHEMSAFRPDEVNDQGQFEHPWLNSEPDDLTEILLIRVKGHLAGFAIVKNLQSDLRLLDCIFLLNAYRGLGIGRESAHMVLDRHPGRWIVLATETSTPAKTFWRRVVRGYTLRQYWAEPSPEYGALAFHFTARPESASIESGSKASSPSSN